jgi:hypothetical protein
VKEELKKKIDGWRRYTGGGMELLIGEFDGCYDDDDLHRRRFTHDRMGNGHPFDHGGGLIGIL